MDQGKGSIIVCGWNAIDNPSLEEIHTSECEKETEREENKTDYWCKNERMWLKNLCQIGTKFNLFHRNVGEDVEAKSKG